MVVSKTIWDFPKIRGFPYFGVLIIRILLLRVLHERPLYSETPYGMETRWKEPEAPFGSALGICMHLLPFKELAPGTLALVAIYCARTNDDRHLSS